MLAVLFLPFALQAQNSWTVADDTTIHAKVPLDFYNCDGSGVRNAQMLYPASLLTDMNGSTIGSITFYHQSTYTKTLTASTWYILMGTTTEADLSEGFSTVALDTVYSGDLVVTNGVFSFELTTPYTYNGGNLIVEIYTTGATGNWFGSSNQGCYGMDGIGSTYSSMSNPNYTAFLPKTTFTEVPSCFPVTNLTVNGTTTNSISLSWTDDINTGITYTVYDMADSSVIESGISGNTYTVNGLTTATGYTFGVEANCSSTDASALVTVSGVTACDANTTFPWTEDFESFDASSSGVTLNAPCWVNEHIAGSGSKLFEVYSSTTATGGNSTKKLRLPDMSSGTMTKLVLPLMDIPTGANYMFSIDVYRNASGSSYTTEGVRVYASTDGQIEGATELGFLYRNYTQTDGGVVSAETVSDWYTYSFTIPFSGNGYIILKGESKYGSATYMDNLAIAEAPACLPVTAQTVTNVTSNSVSLSWTDDANTSASYIIYDMSDTSVVSDITIDGTTAVISNLEPNTAYTFGIVADCGNGDLAGIRTVSTRTECEAMALPWTCGFEADEIMSTTAATALPWCSSRLASTVSNPNYPYSYSTTYSHTGSRALYYFGTTATTYPDTMGLILPEVDVTTYPMNDNRVTFWARMGSASDDKNVYVYTMTDPNDVTTMTLVDSVLVSGTTHVKYAVPLTNATPTAAYLALVVMKGTGTLYLDDLTLEVAPSCPDITGLAVTAITSNSMTLSWNSTEGAMGYTIYDADGELFATTTDTTYTIENLDANTNYTFGLQSNCSAGDGSVSTVSGRTSCAAEALPFIETFDVTLSSDPCWRGATGVTAAEVFNGAVLTLSGISAGYWNYSTSQNGFTDGHYYNNIYGSSRKAWMITPAIDLSTASSAQLSFDLALTAYSGTMQAPAAYTGGQKFMVIVSTDGGNTWLESNATVWMRADSNANYAFEDIPYDHYGNYVINLDQYLGNTIKIAFYGESTVSGGDNNFHIDNIAVTEVPSCPSVMGLTLDGQTATTASIHWNDNGSVGYDVEVRQNDVPLTDVTVVVTDTTAEISGLAVDNDYQIAVRSICGSDYGQWCSPLNIHIGYCTPNPTSVDNNGITSVSFGGMTNTTHPTVAGYANYTSMSGTVPAGLPATVEITYETGYTYGTIIWVDWNNSMSFEGNEVVYAGQSTNNNPTTLAATFDVPATMQQGSYRMRIVGADMAFDSYTSSIAAAANANPCATYSYGVAEDYTLIVGETPSCLPVSNLTVSNITSNGATLTWTGSSADSYSVIDLSDSSVVATVSTETYNLTNLDPMTHYTIGVVANCGSNQSLMVTVSFNTACTAIDLPYTETFASTSSTRDCWNLVSMNTANDVGTSDGMGFMTVNGHYVLRFSSYSSATDYNQYGFSPLMNVSSSATNLMVSVVYATYGSDDLLYFGYVTPTDTVWDPTAYTTNSGTTPSTWETATFIVPANATQVAIHYYGNYKFYGWIDTVNVIEMTGDYCYAVTNLTADNSTTSSISLSWSDDNNTGATYTVYNMADNTVIATGVSGNSYVVTGLTASTSYTFGVVANCSATSEADIVTVNAMTDCADITALPYNEGFENGLGCWTTVNGSTDGNPWNAQGSFSSPAITPHTGNGMAASWSWNNSAMHANAWLISPKFVLPNTTEGLTLTWWERANPYYSDSYSVVLSTTTNDTAAFTTVIRPYDTTAGEWTQQTVDLSAYAGQSIYIAFHHVDYNMNYLLIDDIALTGGSTPTESLTINLSINNPALGTINPLPGTYHVALNDSLVLSATPAAGATFDGWKISVGTQTMGTIPINPFTIPVNPNNIAFGELNVVAMFSDSTSAPDSMTVIINTADATMGTTNPAPGTYNFAVGSQTFVTAIPNDGYQLLYWIESITVGDMTVTDTLLADTIIVNVIPIMAGITSSLTACFEAIPVQPCAVPTGLTATAIHNESIELAWDNANVNGWNVQWRVGTGTWASAHTTTNSYTITGLTGLTTYEIQVQADCGDGNLSDWSNSITATTTNVGIENFTDLKVTLFPNPAREYVDIRIDGNANVTAMEVFDVYGKLINTVNVIDNLTRINVNGLADGMYFVRVTTDNGTVTKTFVKK